MKFYNYLKDDIKIPINVGDTVLGGKFKNKRIVVKAIGTNDKGDITINGKPLLKYRILPKEVQENYSKTGQNERGLTPANKSGFANSVDTYIDPLDPKNKKEKRKPTWLLFNALT